MKKQSAIRSKNTRWGAAIVELMLAMLMMFSLMLFVIFIGRYLTERNRILAASRTLAWLHGYQYDERHDDITDLGGEDFHLLMRHWHFKSQGPAAGIVLLDVQKLSGVFESNGDELNSISEAAENEMNEYEDYLEDIKKQPMDDEKGETVARFVNNVKKALIRGLELFVGDDFNYYKGDVKYGMPLILPREAYAFFFGDAFVGEDFGTGWQDYPPDIVLSQSVARQTYAFFDSAKIGSAVFPSVDSGSMTALGEVNAMFKPVMERLQKITSNNNNAPIFRPNPENSASQDAVATAKQLEALMIYEIYDPEHKYARMKERDTWDFFTGSLWSQAKDIWTWVTTDRPWFKNDDI